MTKATCYYEILGVEETATSDDIKKAYRNLALVWHPDKNQDKLDEAHVKFQSILKAYETLSDSRERDWYDRHKDQILTGGDKVDSDSTFLNLFQFFSSSCYANFDDQEDGFYTVYRKVFDTIAQEEKQNCPKSNDKNSKRPHCDASEGEYPTFGTSTSPYDEIVRQFYAFWSNFFTKITFDHLDTFNTTLAENRRILRAMEKENKKVKDAAKKERNSNIRNLVEFIKKRDKRLKIHKLVVERQNELNRNKTAEKQRQQRKKCILTSAQYKPTAWEDMDDIEEQLRKLEEEYDSSAVANSKAHNPSSDTEDDKACDKSEQSENRLPKEFDDEEEDAGEEEEEEEPDLFCPACNKEFRSLKTFENHEASKKHKQNVIKLTKLLKEEEKSLNK